MRTIEFSPSCVHCGRRNALLIIILTAIVICLIVLLPAATISFSQKTNHWSQAFLNSEAAVTVKTTPINVFLALSTSEISQGLSDRDKLAGNQGMLFLFSDTDYRTFWMQGMRFNLDIIFIRDGAIVDIAKNMPAPSLLQIPAIYKSQSPADTVLEVNAGLADLYGWQVGDMVLINK